MWFQSSAFLSRQTSLLSKHRQHLLFLRRRRHLPKQSAAVGHLWGGSLSLILISPPVLEPVTLYDMKLQLGFGPMDDLDEIKSRQLGEQLRPFIQAARQHCEDFTHTAYITQTWQINLDNFPFFNPSFNRTGYNEIRLPKTPVQSIVSFGYVDTTGTQQTFPPSGYQKDLGSDTFPPRLNALFATPWPVTEAVPDNVSIQYVSGYGDTPDKVPAAIRAAIKLGTAYLFDKGIDAAEAMPKIVYGLLNPYRNLVS